MSHIFQSTLPVRGATFGVPPHMCMDLEFQSTLPVRGATFALLHHALCGVISIHAPRAGSDDIFAGFSLYNILFQSTLPVRGATVKTRIIIRIFK